MDKDLGVNNSCPEDLRILYLTNTPRDVADWRFLTKMVSRGYKVYAVYYCFLGDDYLVEGTEKFSLGYENYIHGGKAKKLLGHFLTHIRFRSVLRQTRPDLAHAGPTTTGGFVAALSRYHPFLLMPWGSDILLTPKSSFFWKKIVQFTIKRADMITCDSEVIKREIIQLTGYPAEKIIVFPRGVDLGWFKPSFSLRDVMRRKLGIENKKVIIMNRRFKPVYGIEYFLKALPQVWSKIPDVYVLLLGSGPLENELRKIVEELNLEPIVKFIGEVSYREMPLYLNASDLYVSSSLSDGTSVSLLEAMACGLPVVVTDVPAIMEWVVNGENGIVVPRKSIDELAQAIIYLLQNEDIRKKMGERNILIAKERADWDRNFNKLEQMYKILISDRQK
jgi:glycosyltransferase involved in cell wall biosynthesis